MLHLKIESYFIDSNNRKHNRNEHFMAFNALLQSVCYQTDLMACILHVEILSNRLIDYYSANDIL